MAFGDDAHFFRPLLHLEEYDNAVGQKLGSHCPRDELWKMVSAQGQILLNLHTSQLVSPDFCLNRDHVLDTLPVDADIQLVGFDLTDTRNRRPQMVLEGVTGDAQKNVDEPVVARTYALAGSGSPSRTTNRLKVPVSTRW